MKRLTLALCAGLFAAGLAVAQTDLQPVALVKLTKTEPISVKQLKDEVQRFETQSGRTLTVDERRQVLDVMINERLALQAAERDKLYVSDAEVNQQLQASRTQMAQAIGHQASDSEFEGAIKAQTGMDLAAFKDQLRRQLTVQKYLLSKKKAEFDTIKQPTDQDIQQFYDLNKAKLVRPDTVRFSMLFVPFGKTDADKGKAKDTATKLINDIGSSSTKFDEAVIRAQAAGSGYQGGDGGYLPKTAEAQKVVGSDFMNVAFSLKQGEVSRLIENQKGYQIIKITETYTQKNLDLDDIYQLGNRTTVRQYIGQMLLQQKQQQVLDTATKELVTELRTGNTFQVFDKNLAW